MFLGDSSSEGLWQSIGQTAYEGNDTVYTFTDNTFTSGYEGKHFQSQYSPQWQQWHISTRIH